MSDVDTKKLRELAEAATPGPWRQGNIEKHNVFVNTPDGEWLGHERVLLRMNTHFEYASDATFIAAANPQAVLALLDRLADAEAERDDFAARWERDEARHAKLEADARCIAAERERERDEALRAGRNMEGIAEIYSNDLADARAELDERTRERDAARANARILAHAYTHDSRPPERAVAESLAYPAIPGKDVAR